MVNRLLVANRGEIALRILRSAAEMGIHTVALYARGEESSMWARAADQAVALAGETAAETYLSPQAVLAAAEAAGADAIHPGYGFLSENAGFARAVEAAGLTWVGPPPEAIELMGDKLSARRAAAAAGVAGVPGSHEPCEDPAEILAFGARHGWPVAIKAAAGGGGRGMRIVTSADEAQEALDSARREAQSAFGNPACYLERYLSRPRHVEVQLLADSHGNVVWLLDRDCSAQRRHQKLLEECPAPAIADPVRKAMGEAAVAVASACDYRGAGTVEFLYSQGEFYFLEMNTRLQVEHPVTEAVCGIDLVEWQLRVASGEALGFTQADISPRGHAIEARINAEDPGAGRFLPHPGRLTRFERPDGPGVRTDTGYLAGDQISPHFDNLVAKVIVWAEDRPRAIARMRRALTETLVEGVATTIPAHEAILSHPDFSAASHHTRWVEDDLDLSALPPAPHAGTGHEGLEEHHVRAEVNGRPYDVRLWLPPTEGRGAPAGRVGRAAASRSAPAASGNEIVTVPMQGVVVKVMVEVGDTVEQGQTLCVLEAMKMENAVAAEIAGRVAELNVSVGAQVAPGDAIAVIEPGE